MLEFNPDGSLKLNADQIKYQELEKTSIVITREQINVCNPAIAQVRIKFPEDVIDTQKIMELYNQIKSRAFSSVSHEIQQLNPRVFIIKTEEGTRLMYTALEHLISRFKYELGKDKNVIIKGNWENYTQKPFENF